MQYVKLSISNSYLSQHITRITAKSNWSVYLPAFDLHHHIPSFVFPLNQDCYHSSRVLTCAASTLKTCWFWTMSGTKLSSRWPHKELRPERSPPLHSPAPSLPSLPCGLLSCCFGVTRPMCRSLLAGWLTHEREVGGSGIRGKWALSLLIVLLCFFWKSRLDITLIKFSFSSASSSYSSELQPSQQKHI